MWSAFLVDLLQQLGEVELMRASELTSSLRVRKDPEEQAALREAAAAVDRVLARIPSQVSFAGRAESEIARDISEMALEEGHQTSEFTIVASGPNGASPHHEPGTRLVEPGDLVVCDFGGRLDGYCSDVTRTFSVGEPGDSEREVYDVVAAANETARDAVMPGASCESIDRTARTLIERQGYGDCFIHRTGHGIGLEVHEHPYLVEGNDDVLEAGMAFSIEPGIYLPGRFGVRIEDIVLCTDSGYESLNQVSRELVLVE